MTLDDLARAVRVLQARGLGSTEVVIAEHEGEGFGPARHISAWGTLGDRPGEPFALVPCQPGQPPLFKSQAETLGRVRAVQCRSVTRCLTMARPDAATPVGNRAYWAGNYTPLAGNYTPLAEVPPPLS